MKKWKLKKLPFRILMGVLVLVPVGWLVIAGIVAWWPIDWNMYPSPRSMIVAWFYKWLCYSCLASAGVLGLVGLL